jgi:transglutaminase-like putative cysteine protease
VHGVKIRVHKAVSVSEKEKVPTDIYLAENGEMVELTISGALKMVLEPASIAKRLDQVEVFGLTRIVLPKPLPPEASAVPGSLTLRMAGLPQKFWRDSYRQKFRRVSDEQVDVTISAAPPHYDKPLPRPVPDPNGGEYLKSSIIVESDSPEIRRQASKILGDERDAYQAAKKIVAWVGSHMKKDYGASADRATDVLRQMKGDCTEHSLLSVALLRAAGIPAKRVDGVVYMFTDGVPAMYWHEWVEAYVGEWTQLDPTFQQTVADATHFAVGEESNAEITPLIGQLKIVEVR